MARSGAVSAIVTVVVGCVVSAALVGCGRSEPKSEAAVDNPPAKALVETQPGDRATGKGKGMEALRQASQSSKYLFAFFFKTEDEQTLAMRKVFDKAMEKASDRAQAVVINATDASEKSIVAKFDLVRAPMPLVLAIAPNGAITGGFPTKFEEQQLLDAFATPSTERVMKSLQDGKLVFVCVQNDKTKSNEAAMQGVRDFKADVRFASATEIVSLDPADKKEAKFLTDLKVAPDTAEATTVFVVPPGQAITKIEGATSKDALVEVLSKANTSCGPGGCGPGGCGPKK